MLEFGFLPVGMSFLYLSSAVIISIGWTMGLMFMFSCESVCMSVPCSPYIAPCLSVWSSVEWDHWIMWMEMEPCTFLQMGKGWEDVFLSDRYGIAKRLCRLHKKTPLWRLPFGGSMCSLCVLSRVSRASVCWWGGWCWWGEEKRKNSSDSSPPATWSHLRLEILRLFSQCVPSAWRQHGDLVYGMALSWISSLWNHCVGVSFGASCASLTFSLESLQQNNNPQKSYLFTEALWTVRGCMKWLTFHIHLFTCWPYLLEKPLWLNMCIS